MQEDLERPITAEILAHWLPWLPPVTFRINRSQGKPKGEALSVAHSAVLREVAAAEFEVWEYAKERYALQKSYLHHLKSQQAPSAPPGSENANP